MCIGVKVAGLVTLVQLASRVALDAVDHTAAFGGRALGDQIGPALHVGVVLHLQELTRAVGQAFGQVAIPGPDRHVGDGVVLPRQVGALGQPPVKYVELALYFHCKPVNRVFNLAWCVGVEVAKPAAQVRRAAHLPEQPRQAFGARWPVSGHKGIELFCKIQQDGAGLEHAHRHWSAAVHQHWYLGVGVGRHETAAELLPLIDADQPGVVFGTAVAQRQQLLQHHRDLYPIGRRQRIKLQWMPAHRQLLLMRWPRNRPVDAGKPATILFVPGPDFGWRVVGRISHAVNSR